MVASVRTNSPEVALAWILQALERELIDASDEEILEVAKDLGMDPDMKLSAAFRGLTYPSSWQLSDFFEIDFSGTLADLLGHTAQENKPLGLERAPARRAGSKRRSRPRARALAPRERKDPDGK